MKSTPRLASTLSRIIIYCVALWIGQSQALAIAIGNRVRADGTVNVRSIPAGPQVGQQTSGRTGTVTLGPTLASLGGVTYTWWYVDFDSGFDGWVASTGLVLVSSGTVDVQPLNVTRTPSTVAPGGSISVSWQIRNNGSAIAASSQSQVRISSSGSNSGGGANNVGSPVATGTIAGGTTINQTRSVTAPTTPGIYYVWVVSDNTSVLTQTDYSNDFAVSSSFTVAGFSEKPQFQLPFSCGETWYAYTHPGHADRSQWALDLNRSPIAGGASNGFGEPVLASASGQVSRLDKINTTTANGIFIELNHGNGWHTIYLHLQEASIPSAIEIGSTVEAGQQIGKLGSTGNSTGPHLHYEQRLGSYPNYQTYPVEFNGQRVDYVEHPARVPIVSANCRSSVDIQPLNVTYSPTTVAPGGSISVAWQVRNNGLATAASSQSQVRISNSSSSPGGPANNVGIPVPTGSIGGGTTINQDTNVTAPIAPGTYYIWVVSDSTGVLTQTDLNNDSATSPSFTVTAPTTVDIEPLNVTRTPATVNPGGLLSVSWQVRNNGSGAAPSSQSQVRISTSSSSSGGPANNVGNPIATGNITGGTTISQSIAVTAPVLPGTYYIWVMADSTSLLTQTDFGNDSARSSSFTVTAPTTVDIEPLSLVVTPSTVSQGGLLSVSWQIRNNGSSPAVSTLSQVRISGSSSDSGGPQNNVGGAVATDSMAVGTVINQNATVTTPSIPGIYYVWVVSDSTGLLNQTDHSNDSVRSEPVTILPSQQSEVKMVAMTVAPGAVVQVPVQLASQGTENSMGFSVNYDTTALAYRGHASGRGSPSGVTVQTNLPAGGGKVGVVLALPPGQTFGSGPVEVLLLEFAAQPGFAGDTTALSFGDNPIARQVVSATANDLPFQFEGATVTFNRGLEGDVAPRPNGNGQLGVADWVQVGRFVALLDTPGGASEHQRADCAPRETSGNGILSVADWVQAGRYAAGLDAPMPAAGPASNRAVQTSEREAGPHADAGARALKVRDLVGKAGDAVVFQVEIDAEGDENALGFSLGWDPALLEYESFGSVAVGMSPLANLSQVGSGRIGMLLALPAGQTLQPGILTLVEIRCRIRTSAPASTVAIRWIDQPIARELIDASVGNLNARYTDGQLVIQSTQTPSHGLLITAVHGKVSRSPDQTVYAAGTYVQLTAVANTGYQFTGWAGGATGMANPTTVLVDRDLAVTALFEPVPVGETGIVLGSPQPHPEGGWTVRVSAPPGTLYHLEESQDLLKWQPVSAGELPESGSHNSRVQRRDVEVAIYFRAKDVAGSTVTLRPGPQNSKDVWTTSVYAYAPDRQFPGGGMDNDQLRVGGWGDDYWGLMEFDLTTMPRNASQVRLELYCYEIGGGGGTPMQIHRITEPWGWVDRLWWADRPEMALVDETVHPAAAANAWYSMDLTKLYNSWQSGEVPNHGLVLIPMETWDTFNNFTSADTTNVALRPRLVVTTRGFSSGPQLLADNLRFPMSPALSGDHVYFSDNSPTRGVIRRVPKSGGEVSEVAGDLQIMDSGSARGPSGLIVAGSHLFGHYGGYGTLNVFRLPLAGGIPETLMSLSGGILLSAEESRVWYSRGFSQVVQMNLSTGESQTQTSGVWPRGYASDAAAVYYIDYSSKHVWRLDKASGEVQVIRAGTGSEGHLAEGGDFLFLNLAGSIHRFPKNGGEDTVIVTGAFGGGQASDGQYLYFLKEGRIRAIPVAGGAEIDLAPGPNGETEIAVDSTHVFWTDWSRGIGLGQIWRVRRP